MRALFVIFSALLWVFTNAGAADAQAQVKYLDWPGKPRPNAAIPMPATQPAPVEAPQTVAPSPSVGPAPVMAAATPPAQTFAPTSIYDAPPPVAAADAAQPAAAVAPVASASVASASTDRPRLYSLHRDYGEQPDRAVIPAPVYLDHLPVDLSDKSDKTSKQAKDDADKPDAADSDDNSGGAA
ncbi:MAG TPA: hypothetical protein VG407_13320 [Caulobacteraceae bacterium]|jgi:hypothetical protein|nr:hypothetical protein [Caulobacteraceae bacterium]